MPSTGSIDMTPDFHECQRTEAPLLLQGISIEELSVEQFRRKCVEPMGEESDEVHIVALTDVLQVGARDWCGAISESYSMWWRRPTRCTWWRPQTCCRWA
jgi:Peptidase C65 Otubain